MCEKGGGSLIVVTDKGKQSLKKFAKLRHDDRVLETVENVDVCVVHERCRKWYNNHRRIESERKEQENKLKEDKV